MQKLAAALSIALATAGVAPGLGLAEGAARRSTQVPATGPREGPQPDPWSGDNYVDPLSVQGQQARGLYFNGPMQKRLGARGIIRAVKGANLDAAVLDLKDGEGRVLWDTSIDVLQPQKRLYVKDMAGLIAELKAAGIYTISRIVCFSDPKLPVNFPDRAVIDSRPNRNGRVWALGQRRNTWLDPYNTKNHDLIIAMAKEAEALGIDEIQFDYIRFPVDDATQFAMFPAQVDKPRREVLLGLLKRVDAELTIPIGVDVFGLTAFRKGDPAGLGQSLELWARYVEVFSPMLYINGMTAWVRDEGSQRAMRLILVAMKNLRRRLGHGPVIRPFMQAFPAGADYYNAAFITEQILGARNGGADGFLFWHPASNYGMVKAGMLGPARQLTPFPLEDRYPWRRQSWGDRMSAQARAEYYEQAPPRAYLR